MIERILAEAVVVEESFGEVSESAWLYPEEEEVVASAVDKRRQEFGSCLTDLERLVEGAKPARSGIRHRSR
ncbi:hypothetical protein ACIRPT_27225 [Streptomyces sp. NPDC101227]|uniref:hypothetical protein n=1 Tax=Streptomyces sp. NPDC101227 TaxID=3366136 RepID=UPI00381755B9